MATPQEQYLIDLGFEVTGLTPQEINQSYSRIKLLDNAFKSLGGEIGRAFDKQSLDDFFSQAESRLQNFAKTVSATITNISVQAGNEFIELQRALGDMNFGTQRITPVDIGTINLNKSRAGNEILKNIPSPMDTLDKQTGRYTIRQDDLGDDVSKSRLKWAIGSSLQQSNDIASKEIDAIKKLLESGTDDLESYIEKSETAYDNDGKAVRSWVTLKLNEHQRLKMGLRYVEDTQNIDGQLKTYRIAVREYDKIITDYSKKYKGDLNSITQSLKEYNKVSAERDKLKTSDNSAYYSKQIQQDNQNLKALETTLSSVSGSVNGVKTSVVTLDQTTKEARINQTALKSAFENSAESQRAVITAVNEYNHSLSNQEAQRNVKTDNELIDKAIKKQQELVEAKKRLTELKSSGADQSDIAAQQKVVSSLQGVLTRFGNKQLSIGVQVKEATTFVEAQSKAVESLANDAYGKLKTALTEQYKLQKQLADAQSKGDTDTTELSRQLAEKQKITAELKQTYLNQSTDKNAAQQDIDLIEKRLQQEKDLQDISRSSAEAKKKEKEAHDEFVKALNKEYEAQQDLIKARDSGKIQSEADAQTRLGAATTGRQSAENKYLGVAVDVNAAQQEIDSLKQLNAEKEKTAQANRDDAETKQAQADALKVIQDSLKEYTDTLKENQQIENSGQSELYSQKLQDNAHTLEVLQRQLKLAGQGVVEIDKNTQEASIDVSKLTTVFANNREAVKKVQNAVEQYNKVLKERKTQQNAFDDTKAIQAAINKMQELLAAQEKLKALKNEKASTAEINAQIQKVEQLKNETEQLTSVTLSNGTAVGKTKTYTDAWTKAIDDLTASQNNSNASTQQSSSLLDKLSGKFSNVISNVIRYNAAQFSLNTVVNKTIGTIKSLDKSMTEVRLVTGESAESARETMNSYADLAKQLGATTTEVASGSVEWLRQGKTAQETSQLLTASTMLSKLGMMDANEATEKLTATLNGYKFSASQATDVVDKLVNVDLNKVHYKSL